MELYGIEGQSEEQQIPRPKIVHANPNYLNLCDSQIYAYVTYHYIGEAPFSVAASIFDQNNIMINADYFSETAYPGVYECTLTVMDVGIANQLYDQKQQIEYSFSLSVIACSPYHIKHRPRNEIIVDYVTAEPDMDIGAY